LKPRAIGSVLPLPDVEDDPPRTDNLWNLWTAERPHAAFRSARSALTALLDHRRIRRVWLPAYVCRSLADGAANRILAWYDVGEELAPDVATLARELAPGDAVVGVDYFGRLPPQDFIALAAARTDVLWIEDRAQAIDPGPAWGQILLHSPRKLIGVGDGGLLVGDHLPEPDAGPSPDACEAQRARARDPDGRAPEHWYELFQAQERAFTVDRAPMSARTRRILERSPAAPLAARRRHNAQVLTRALGDLALWPDLGANSALLAVPVRLADRDHVAAELARRGIYCARHWSDLPSPVASFPVAQRLSGELLSLPCDHRYDAADMERIIDALRDIQATGAR
jgi:dTDP-4-amino-4,6-dideoxygalactose transaminase